MPSFNVHHFLFLLESTVWTVVLSLAAFAGGGVLGFLVALARISPIRWLRYGAIAYVQVVQGIPLLILMFVVYFGAIIAGWRNVPVLAAASLAIIVYASAFLGEIWRGCIQSVAKTQWEAAECLGLTRWQRMTRVILPQAMRIATPPTVGFLVQIIKNTSLASAIGLVELAQAGKLINNSTFQPFLVFVLVAAIYFALCYPLSLWSRSLERKLNVGRR